MNYPTKMFENDYKVLILEQGKVKEFKVYQELFDSGNRDFKNFY